MSGNREPIELQELIRQVEEHLHVLNYQRHSIQHCRKIWDMLCKYDRDHNIIHFKASLGHDFLCSCFDCDPTAPAPQNHVLRGYRRSVAMLCDFHLHGVIFRRNSYKYKQYPSQFERIFSDFRAALVNRGLAHGTLRAADGYLMKFALYLDAKGIRKFSEVNIENIQGYILTLAHLSKQSVAYAMCILRELLTFTCEQGYIQRNLSFACPKIRYWTRSPSIPSAFSKDEVRDLLATVDRGNPLGKRDYAILMLAAHQGLRAGEIRNLQFEHLKWEKHCIEFVQTKTNKWLSLPLLPDVGWAIIDYIQYGRPKQAEPNFLFVIHQAPYAPFGLNDNMHHLMVKYLRKAEIKLPKGKRCGLHTLRHSLASSLLENNTPMPVISEVLNHSGVETTNIYCKIDISKLKECALEVDSNVL